MGVKLIHGYLHEKQRAKPEWGSISVTETVLIEMDSANDDMIDVLSSLPAGPNSVTATNPTGVTFTFDVSVHTKSNALVLRTAGEVKQSEGGATFWEVELTYGIFSIHELQGFAGFGHNSHNPKQRKDQREFTDPIDRPVVWNSSTQQVRKQTYKKADGLAAIVHTNGLPISTPVEYEETHETHNFSYNIDATLFDYEDFRPFIGKVANAGCLGRGLETIKFTSFNVSEEFESAGTGVDKVEYHFYRVTLSFEYNPSKWTEDAKIVSMSTLQISVDGDRYERIKISETEYAEEPWPLDADGQAIPYTAINPDNFGYIDHGFPRTANLDNVVDANALSGMKALSIP